MKAMVQPPRGENVQCSNLLLATEIAMALS